MTVTIWRHLLIDRISISVKIMGKDLHAFVYGQMHSMQEIQGELMPQGRIMMRHDKYQTRLDFYAAYTHKRAGRRKIADIILGVSKLKNHEVLHQYFRLTLYPASFHIGDFTHFKEVLETLLPEFSYKRLYYTGKVNYLELAADCLSRQLHSFLPYRKYCSDSMVYQKHGVLGTIYLGSVASAQRVRVYDKRKQLSETGKALFTQKLPHTRIEAIQRNIGLHPAELAVMKNPFQKIQIVDLEQIQAASVDVEWPAFINECRQHGVPRALYKYTHKRKQFLSILDANQAAWWDPQYQWEGLAHALTHIEP